MEKFFCKRTLGGYITAPADPTNHPLLSRIHLDDGASKVTRLLPWPSIESGLRLIRSVADRLGLSVQVCGDWRSRPTVILREKPVVAEPAPIDVFKGIGGAYAAKWSVSDFYDEEALRVKDAVASGLPFDTGWYSVKKEIQTARVSRDRTHGPITVEVSQCMDDARDLVDTAFWAAAGGNAYCDSGYDALEKHGLSEDEIEATLDEVADSTELGDDNCEQASETIHWRSGFDRVCDALDRCAESTDTALKGWYDSVVEVCRDRLKWTRDEKQASCHSCKHFSAGWADSRSQPGAPDECGHPKYYRILTVNKHFPFKHGCKFWEARNRQVTAPVANADQVPWWASADREDSEVDDDDEDSDLD